MWPSALLLSVLVACCGGEPRTTQPVTTTTATAPSNQAPVALLSPFSPPGKPLVTRPAPPAVAAPRDPVVSLAAWGEITCAASSGGTAWCWGGDFGAVRRIDGWTDVTRVALGERFVCAVHRDGRVDCGSTYRPTITGDRAAIATRFLGGVRAAAEVATSGDAVCVLERSGEIGCWADGAAKRVIRTRIAGAQALLMTQYREHYEADDISYACALVPPSRVACFDVDLVTGTTPTLHVGTPRVVAALDGASALIAATGDPEIGTQGTVCASIGGATRCAGLGKHPVADPKYRPLCTVAGATVSCYRKEPRSLTATLDRPPVKVASGYAHACAITPAGGVACWGDNREGQLGRGKPGPAPVIGLHDAIGLAGYGNSVLALRANGQLAYWGYAVDDDLPDTDIPITYSNITDAKQLVAGREHACVLRRGGTVACWTFNKAEVFSKKGPADIPGLRDVVEIRRTDYGVMARLADGRLFHVGDSQLGATAAKKPAPVPGAERAAGVAIASWWVCILDRAPGPVRCHAETQRGPTPEIIVGGLRDVVEITGAFGAFALRRADGRALAATLSVENMQSTERLAPLADHADTVFATWDQVCARGPEGGACFERDRPSHEIPPEHARARSLIVGRPSCSVQPDGQVSCYGGDALLAATGSGQTEAPVPVELR